MNLQKELVMGLDMQLLHHRGCGWKERGHVMLHQDQRALIITNDSVIKECQFLTISKNEIAAYYITPTTKNAPISKTPCVYELHVDEIMMTQNLQLSLLTTIHLKGKKETSHLPITLVNSQMRVFIYKNMFL